MELTLSDKKTKELMAEILIEMIREEKDAALANAIVEGRKDNFVNEESILEILGD